MAGVRTVIGDIFVSKIEDTHKKYLQYIANDLTQLNSDVIRVFKKTYSVSDEPELSTVVNDDVEFYAHCVTKVGMKLGYWKKVGNCQNVGRVDVLFRSSGDRANQDIKVSQNWWIWKVDEEQVRVGRLKGLYRNAEIGSVIPPDSIIYRMRTGEYDFVYPDFE